MSALVKNKRKKMPHRDFNTSVLNEHVVPTAIYSLDDAVGYSAYGWNPLWSNRKRRKLFKL